MIQKLLHRLTAPKIQTLSLTYEPPKPSERRRKWDEEHRASQLRLIRENDPLWQREQARKRKEEEKKESLTIYAGKMPPVPPLHRRLLGEGGFWQDAALTEKLREAKARYEADHAEDIIPTPEAIF